jgi:8-oxo-dGTP diphosphatase
MPEEALHREIWEEMETDICVERLITTVEYDYPTFHLTMHCFLCSIVSGKPQLKEHAAAKWLRPTELEDLKWLPADVEVVKQFVLKQTTLK